MDTSPRGFFFRNRRWLLLLLAVIVFVRFRPSLANPTAERLARLLDTYADRPTLVFWLHAVYGLAAVLIGLGALWRTWGSAYLGTNVVQDRQMHTSRLVADGPYRRTRNPLYFGNMLMALGLGLLLDPLPFVVLVLGMWVLVRLFIRDEEAGLEQSGGDSYRAYCAAVPRLLPALRARIPAAGARPRWLQGFCGEAVLWALTILVAVKAVSLTPGLFHGRALGVFVIAILLLIWARRSSKKQAEAGSA